MILCEVFHHSGIALSGLVHQIIAQRSDRICLQVLELGGIFDSAILMKFAADDFVEFLALGALHSERVNTEESLAR